MKVIVAGLPKTGTKSMNAALTQLGYKVYDSPENVYYFRHEYAKIIKDGWTTEDFRKMYENIDAGMDIPVCFFWDEILKAFPDAKVILTLREDENIWVESLLTQFKAHNRFDYYLLRQLSRTGKYITEKVTDPIVMMMFGYSTPSLFSPKVHLNAELAKKSYRSHNAYVMKTAPKDQLLVFKCTEGWEPLCKFLGVAVPEGPFPHKNIKGDMLRELEKQPLFKQIERESMVSLAWIATVTGGSAFLCYKYGASKVYHAVYDGLIRIAQTVWNR